MSEHTPLADHKLQAELAPTVERLMNRHLEKSEIWFPHEFVPWSRGEDFKPDYKWDETRAKYGPETQDALTLNILTEDNLPEYYRSLYEQYGPDGPWAEWSRRWTAEEGRHSQVIRDYLTVSRAVDLRQLERDRMVQVSKGITPNPPSLADGIVYVALQELATRISHRNTGKLLDDPVGKVIMDRVAADETLHHILYKDLVAAGIEIDPSGMVLAVDRQVRFFEMPGTGIPDFKKRARNIAKIGVYGYTEFKDKVVEPVIYKQWKIDRLEGLSSDAEAARDSVANFLTRLGDTAVKREEETRQKFAEAQAA